MADASQIEQAIAEALGAALYPNGTAQPGALIFPVKIERGWPTEAGLAEAKKSTAGLIAVHQKAGFAKNATRYARDWYALTQAAPTIDAAISANVITLSGVVTAGNIVGVFSSGHAYTHVALATDTLLLIAATLAAAIPGASATGAVITLPSTGESPAVSVAASGTGALEVARQQAGFSISCFAPSPANRDAMIGLVFPASAMIDPVTLPDGTVARQLSQQESGPDDMPMRVGMWKREIMVVFDYPVMFTAQQAAMAALVQTLTANATPVIAYSAA